MSDATPAAPQVLWAHIIPTAPGSRAGTVASAPVLFAADPETGEPADPNVLFPGMVWARVPTGASVTDGMTWDGEAFGPAPAPVLSVKALLDYASACQDSTLAGEFAFNVAAPGQPAHAVTTRLDQRGQFAMLKVQGWLQLNASNPDARMPYSNVDFSATTLAVSEADSLVEQAAALDTQSYTILNALVAGIQASPPTITTAAQIRAAFAALVPAAA